MYIIGAYGIATMGGEEWFALLLLDIVQAFSYCHKFDTIMTPNEIAQKIIARAKDKSHHDTLFADSLAKEIASAISEERELLSRYLTFLNESIAIEPQLVRHRLLMGSTRISTGHFLDEMQPDERKSYALRLNSAHTVHYVRG